jgi:hypothetical protein
MADDTLDPASPAGSASPTQGDDRIRELKRAFIERLIRDHYLPQSGGVYDGDQVGHHENIRIKEVASAPSTPAGFLGFYVKDVSGQPELFWRKESDGAEIQLTSDGVINTGILPAPVVPAFENALLHIRDEKTANTEGGTFTGGAWQTRVLNSVKTNQISGASVASNQITLPAGTYYIDASAPVHGDMNGHKIRLYNVTDTADILIGTQASAASTLVSGIRDVVSGRFTLAAEKVIELQHYCGQTVSTNGFGLAVNIDGKVEVYSDVKIWKVA